MALKNAYLALRRDYNDFRIVSRGSYAPSRFSLLAIIRNEMYFLPSFLDHYRKLGVKGSYFLMIAQTMGLSITSLSSPTWSLWKVVELTAINLMFPVTFKFNKATSNLISLAVNFTRHVRYELVGITGGFR